MFGFIYSIRCRRCFYAELILQIVHYRCSVATEDDAVFFPFQLVFVHAVVIGGQQPFDPVTMGRRVSASSLLEKCLVEQGQYVAVTLDTKPTLDL